MPYRLLLPVLFFLLFSCSSLSKEEETLLGDWKAQWRSAGSWINDLPADRRSMNVMNGRMKFSKNQDLTITGYGYPGCVFSQDTIENTLKWKLDQQVIRLYNYAHPDSFIMAYKIREIREDTLKFLFLEDIEITLIKEN